MKLLVDVKLEVDVPEQYHNCEAALKRWLWEERKDDLLNAMRFKEIKGKSPPVLVPHDVNQKLQLLDTISKVQRHYLHLDKQNIVFGVLLNALLDLMNSEYGFIAEVKYESDGTMYLQSYSGAVTNIAWNDETRALYDEHIETGLKFYNVDSLFGKVMTTQEVVISNNPKEDPRACGIPPGHPPLNHFLGVPFFDQGCKNMVGMVGLANKPGGYSPKDVEFLEPFLLTCSNLIQAFNAIQENRRLINTLEDKVAERTRELSLANKHLEDANRKVLAASAAQLTNFACMSHEIRTPLNCIIGLSGLLLETELSDKQRESLHMIVTSGELLCTVVNDILDYSRLLSGNVAVEIQRTNLQETLNAVVKSVDHKARSKHLRFETEYSSRLPEFVNTDNNRLQQILFNLLGNAIKFSDEGGCVKLLVDVIDPNVRASPCPENTPADVTEGNTPPSRCPFHRAPMKALASASQSTSIQSQASQQYLRFTVTDNGRGIDVKDFGRIFEPFSQASGETERLYGGTGLGLAITAKLVERLGGKISVESELGKWSKFTVDIPAVFSGLPDVSGLVRFLKDARILYVDYPDAQYRKQVVYNLELPVEHFESCEDMCNWIIQEEGKADQPHTGFNFCIVQEDLFVPRAYHRLAEEAPTALITFGPREELSESQGHFRSLSEVIPCVLLQYLVDTRKKSMPFASVPRPSQVNFLHRVNVLIAEDNLINQKVLCKMLERLGVEHIDIANNGREAVEMTAKKHYDVIFMDMQMPVMCGDEACRIICEQSHGKPRRPKVVFVTAHAYSTYETKALEAGADGFISKPFNVKKLEDYIKSLDL